MNTYNTIVTRCPYCDKHTQHQERIKAVGYTQHSFTTLGLSGLSIDKFIETSKIRETICTQCGLKLEWEIINTGEYNDK